MGGQGKAQAAIDTPRLEGFDAKLADAVQWCSLRRGDRMQLGLGCHGW
jgi:hypothetical protein